MLVKPQQLFREALAGKFAIGAFNTSNLEITQAIVAAAEAQRAPVIVQTSEGAIKYAGLPVITGIITAVANAASVPVVLHLDHGKSAETARRCIDAGYTSVMIDASALPLQENIRLTAEVVQYAHEQGVWVEAELGAILGAEGAKKLSGKHTPDDFLTNPGQAQEFVEKTGVDALAVSVGTIHGAFTGQEYVRFELLQELERLLPAMPLVVHGASGLAARTLKQVAASHVCKINIDTEVRIAVEQAIKGYFSAAHEMTDYRDIFGAAREAAQRVVAEKIATFGAAGRAKV